MESKARTSGASIVLYVGGLSYFLWVPSQSLPWTLERQATREKQPKSEFPAMEVGGKTPRANEYEYEKTCAIAVRAIRPGLCLVGRGSLQMSRTYKIQLSVTPGPCLHPSPPAPRPA